jgi:hypothetical protein
LSLELLSVHSFVVTDDIVVPSGLHQH